MTADEAFEVCALWLESNAELHFAYSDPQRDRFKENPRGQAYFDQWRHSGEFLDDAARQVRKFQLAERAKQCVGYPSCDGDLVVMPHSPSCPCFVQKTDKV